LAGCCPFEELAAAISAVGIDEGAVRRGIDRYEELTCEGENPRTTLVVLLSEVPLSDDAGCAEWSEASSEVTDLLSTAGVMICGVDVGCCVAGVASGASGARGGRLLRESGSRSFFSLIVMTIFSRSSGVMCRSRPRLRLWIESCR
jgi:hypothetical protein